MKNKINQAIKLTQQAMNLVSGASSKHCDEARLHLKNAIKNLEKFQHHDIEKNGKKQKQFESWWSGIQSGTAHMASANLSKEAHLNSLKRINQLIEKEQESLNQLEQMSKNHNKEQGLLTE